MELNLTIEHFAGFCLMAYVAHLFVSGTRLLRMICWIALWQLLTPVRPAWQDIPMMLASWAMAELLYWMAQRSFTRHSA